MRIDLNTGRTIGGGRAHGAARGTRCAPEVLALEDLAPALRAIAAMEAPTPESRAMRQAAPAGLRAASRWMTPPETP